MTAKDAKHVTFDVADLDKLDHHQLADIVSKYFASRRMPRF